MTSPSGEQFEIAHGAQRATVVEVGGGLRSYSSGERDVLEPYARESICDGAHGAVLAPWPNRLDGGRYEFDGRNLQLALSEPARGNAIHGLLRWRPWRALSHEPARVVMRARLHPEPGYPFDLEVSVEYSLGESGLVVVTTATNLGEGPCPFGAGQHPYLSPGRAPLEECALELRAATMILSDSARGLPTERVPARGSAFDFNEPRALGESVIDAAYDRSRSRPTGHRDRPPALARRLRRRALGGLELPVHAALHRRHPRARTPPARPRRSSR